MLETKQLVCGIDVLLKDFCALLQPEKKELYNRFSDALKMLCVHQRYAGGSFLCPDDIVDAVDQGKIRLKIGG